MLTSKYLDGVPEASRARESNTTLSPDFLTERSLANIRALNEIAERRGQTLAQMAIAWVLRDPRVTTALVGASRWSQIEHNLGALDNLEFSDSELQEINESAVESGINLWAESSDAG